MVFDIPGASTVDTVMVDGVEIFDIADDGTRFFYFFAIHLPFPNVASTQDSGAFTGGEKHLATISNKGGHAFIKFCIK